MPLKRRSLFQTPEERENEPRMQRRQGDKLRESSRGQWTPRATAQIGSPNLLGLEYRDTQSPIDTPIPHRTVVTVSTHLFA